MYMYVFNRSLCINKYVISRSVGEVKIRDLIIHVAKINPQLFNCCTCIWVQEFLKARGQSTQEFLFLGPQETCKFLDLAFRAISILFVPDRKRYRRVFGKFYKCPYSFLYYLEAIMDEMRKRGRHLVQYFCQ